MEQSAKIFLEPMHDLRYIRETFKLYPITCPHLLILAKRSHKLITDLYPILEELKKCKKFTVITLDGGHDIHITNPELVAPHITEFLLVSESKL